MFYKRFKFVKDLTIKEGTFKKGDEITILENHVYYNGGMTQPYYSDLLMDLIEFETNERNGEYLKEIPIPYNKA